MLNKRRYHFLLIIFRYLINDLKLCMRFFKRPVRGTLNTLIYIKKWRHP